MSYRRANEQPPEAFRRVTKQAGHRVGLIFEVDPSLMTDHVRQQAIPLWDTHRIVDSRIDPLAWMHRHWAAKTFSGEELLAEVEEDWSTPTSLPSYEPILNSTPDTTETRS